MQFKITNEIAASRIDEVIEFLTSPRLWIPKNDYPDYFNWLQKSYTELKKGTKRSMIAFYGKEMVGVVIYQSHKTRRNVLEIKNITIRPDLKGRHIASFLVRNTEIEGQKEFKSDLVTCDTKIGNKGMSEFLKTNHYVPIGECDLYKLGSDVDLIFEKKLNYDASQR